MIAFSCSHCQSKLKVKDELAGKRIRCRHCQAVQEVPLASQGETSAGTRSAAHGRVQAGAPDGATLPPSHSESVVDEVTLPPRTAPLPGPTITYQASDHQPADVETREVVKAGSAYEVEGEIARGGMGAIMRAVDQDIRREVAVKFLLNHADDSLKTRFIEEAQITGQLEHPNIVPIHQLGVHEDGRCFFSMKMVKGRSLADILKEQGEPQASATGGEFTLGRLLNIFSNICNALAYAHSHQVIHRDLKPANIMVGDFGEVYVMDWGLAKVLGREDKLADPRPKAGKKASASKVATSRAVDSHLTQAGAIMGTPAYMPPEQAAGEAGAVDERSDIYALGAILYEILTLAPPVGRGGDMVAILMRVVDGDIKPPEKQAPQRARQGLIPPELSAVALKALAKDPANRYQTVEVLQHDIQLFVEGRSVSAKRDSAWELFKKLVKRNKGVSVATAAAFVFLTVGAAVALFFINQERQDAITARDEAQTNLSKFEKEQDKRLKQGRDSIPSLLTAARALVDNRDFDAARAQVQVALGFYPDHPEVRFLNGQLALVAEDFPKSKQELEFFAGQKPDNLLVRDLLEFLPQAKANDNTTRLLLAEIFTRHRAFAMADGALKSLAESAPEAREKLLALYRKRLWAGQESLLQLDPGKGTFHLALGAPFKELKDLSPLRGIPLRSLQINSCPHLRDLGPLKGMPLTSLSLVWGAGFQTLEPLRGMKLTFLNLHGLSEITTLDPLRAMPLESLNIAHCTSIPDLEPLRGMKTLTELICTSHGGMKLSSLKPLAGLKLKVLHLGNARLITDISPLGDMPLESLNLGHLWEIQSFEPLRGRPLNFLDLTYTPIRDLDVLKGMPLKRLVLDSCQSVSDLKPLADLQLTELSLSKGLIQDLSPLAKIKLMQLSLYDCQNLKTLETLRGAKVQTLILGNCKQIDDLSPLADMELRSILLTPRFIKKGWETLRSMKTLDTIHVDGERTPIQAAEFWKRFDKGEFKQ